MTRARAVSTGGLQVTPVRIADEITGETPLHEIVLAAIRDAGIVPARGDILTVCSKIVSKAEGRLVELASVEPSAEARRLAERCCKPPELVQLILDESVAVSRVAPEVLITRHRLGFVSANAAIDASNVHRNDHVLLLPVDPGHSACRLYDALHEALDLPIPVVVTDSHGRPFRKGTVGVALACVGIDALIDHVGTPDRDGRLMQATETALADQIATAADLMVGQGPEGTPLAWVRGVEAPAHRHKPSERRDTVNLLLRDPARDLYA